MGTEPQTKSRETLGACSWTMTGVDWVQDLTTSPADLERNWWLL